MDEGQTHIRVRDCSCEGQPHPEGDYVDLAPGLSLAGGMAAQGAMIAAGGDAVILQEQLARVWVRHGVIGWNLVDDRGRPRPVSPEMVEAEFPYSKGGLEIAEACDDLYKQEVLNPLIRRLARLSERGSMGDIQTETSPKTTSTSKPRKRSSTESTGRALPVG